MFRLLSGGIILLILAVSGCTAPGAPSPTQTPLPQPSPAALVAGGNVSQIPQLFTADSLKTAEGCGWTKGNIAESADLFMGSCQVKSLLGDGWEIVGMDYAMDLLGSPCRASTHPGAPADCNWCDGAGPTLTLRYHGQMETQLIADLKTRTVRTFGSTLPDGTASVSRNGTESVVFRNGTVY